MRNTLLPVALAALILLTAVLPIARAEDAAAPKPIKVLLVLGGCCHDYKAQKDILAKGLAERANVEVTIAHDPDSTTHHLNPVYANADWSKGYDLIIHDECTADEKDLKIIDGILAPHKDGLPAVVLHCGMHCYRSEGWNNPKTPSPWMQFTGLQTTGHGAQKPIEITFTPDASPITKGMANWTTGNEELYNNIAGKALDTATVLARGKQGTADNVLIWTNNYNGKAKVFATTLGHNNSTVSDPRYLDLVTRGVLWATNHLNDDGTPATGYGPKK